MIDGQPRRRSIALIGLNTCVMILSLYGPAMPAAAAHDTIEVWVVLSEPALATLPRDATEQRAALRQRIVMQQNEVMAQLAALGATESGRTQQVRNALAVRLPTAAIPSVKKISDVTEVRAVNNRNRIGGEHFFY